MITFANDMKNQKKIILNRPDSVIPMEHRVDEVRKYLFSKLIEEKVFWSYNMVETDPSDISDEMLISLTLKYLDLNEINLLKEIFPIKTIKYAWIKYLLPEGSYLFTLNRFIAWYIFNIKKPDTYIKRMETRSLKKNA